MAELSVGKLGGGGDICSPRPLGLGDIQWAPVLQGNLGHLTANNDFPGGYLQGNRLVYDVLAVQGGGGARFYFTEPGADDRQDLRHIGRIPSPECPVKWSRRRAGNSWIDD